MPLPPAYAELLPLMTLLAACEAVPAGATQVETTVPTPVSTTARPPSRAASDSLSCARGRDRIRRFLHFYDARNPPEAHLREFEMLVRDVLRASDGSALVELPSDPNALAWWLHSDGRRWLEGWAKGTPTRLLLPPTMPKAPPARLRTGFRPAIDAGWSEDAVRFASREVIHWLELAAYGLGRLDAGGRSTGDFGRTWSRRQELCEDSDYAKWATCMAQNRNAHPIVLEVAVAPIEDDMLLIEASNIEGHVAFEGYDDAAWHLGGDAPGPVATSEDLALQMRVLVALSDAVQLQSQAQSITWPHAASARWDLERCFVPSMQLDAPREDSLVVRYELHRNRKRRRGWQTSSELVAWAVTTLLRSELRAAGRIR